MSKEKKAKTVVTLSPFDEKIHRMGLISTVIVWAFFILVPAGVNACFGIKVDWGVTIKAALPIMLIFAVTGVCEKMSMSPVIGPGAVYLASSTGNVQNMKLPAALNAMNIMNCEEGSEKGRVISIIAVATSSFVTTFIIFCGMAFLGPIITPLLSNEAVKPAFDNMFPALVGPLVIPMILKNWKSATVPVVLAIVFALLLGSSFSTYSSIIMVVVIALSIGAAYLSYRKKNAAPKAEK